MTYNVFSGTLNPTQSINQTCTANSLVNPVLRSKEQNACLFFLQLSMQDVLQSSIVLSVLDNVIAV